MAAVLAGSFVGLVALAAILLLRDSPEVDPATAPDAATTTLSVTSSGVDPPAADPDDGRRSLREFVDFATGTDGTLLRTGNQPDRVIAACEAAITDAAAKFGALPPAPPRIPDGLVTALDGAGEGVDGVVGRLIDTFFRRLEACTDRDQALYDQLKVEEDALRDQLPDL